MQNQTECQVVHNKGYDAWNKWSSFNPYAPSKHCEGNTVLAEAWQKGWNEAKEDEETCYGTRPTA